MFFRRYAVAAFAAGVMCFAAASEANAAPGVCDTGSAVEVESTGGSLAGIPTGYANLGAAFGQINLFTKHLGTVNIEICGNTVETSTAQLNPVPGVTSVLIKPAGGGARTVSGNLAGNSIIKFNGSGNYTIDGLNSAGNSLKIFNGSTSPNSGTSTIQFMNDSKNNTVTRTTVQGSSTGGMATESGTILIAPSNIGGNDNITISSCVIGPVSSTTLPSKAIHSAGIGMDNLQILNNYIYDYFSASGDSAGVNLGGANSATVQNNRFYQTAGRSVTAVVTVAKVHSAVMLNSSNGIFNVNGNTIGYASSAATGSTSLSGYVEFRGINAVATNASTASTISGNSITAISVSSSVAESDRFTGIFLGQSSGRFNVLANSIGTPDGASWVTVHSNANSPYTHAMGVYGVYDRSHGNSVISGNTISHFYIYGSGNRTGFAGIYNYAASSTPSVTIESNSITDISDVQNGDYSFRGIYSGGTAANITNNVVRNLDTRTVNEFEGIVVAAATTNNTVAGNTVHSLSSVGARRLKGIELDFGNAYTNLVSRNFVHTLEADYYDPKLAEITGIDFSGNADLRNNMVRLGITASGGSFTDHAKIKGIHENSSGMTSSLHFNTVYVGGNGVGPPSAPNSNDYATFAFYSSATSGSLTYRNNIFANLRNNVGAGAGHYAIGLPNDVPYRVSDYNIYDHSGYGGGCIAYDGYWCVPGLLFWTGGLGANSIEADPLLVNPTGTFSDVNLHLLSGTPAEGAGLAIFGIDEDFDGQLRSGLSPTDIGADAGNF